MDFGAVGEPVAPDERAAAVEEKLAVLDALWSGEPVTRHGRFLTVEEVRMPARPVQRPRIPIWIGGCAGRRGPRQRALRWDGSCLYAVPPPAWRDLSASEVGALRAEAREHSGDDDFVVAVGGRERRDDLGREADYVTSIAEAGADWWHEYVDPRTPPDAIRARIAGGPVRARS